MTLDEELAQLEVQRNAELRNLNYLYSRTRRDIRRAISPDRMVRDHIGLIMGAAAMAGMVAAPAPASGSGRTAGGHIGSLLTKLIPAKFRKFIPKPATPSATESSAATPPPGTPASKRGPKPRTLVGTLLAELLPLIIGRINWSQLLHQAIAAYTQSMQGKPNPDAPHPTSDDPTHQPETHTPNMQPGNAGVMPG
jgi:hypothetical protein